MIYRQTDNHYIPKSVFITNAFKICLYKHNGVEVPQEKSQLKVEKKKKKS